MSRTERNLFWPITWVNWFQMKRPSKAKIFYPMVRNLSLTVQCIFNCPINRQWMSNCPRIVECVSSCPVLIERCQIVWGFDSVLLTVQSDNWFMAGLCIPNCQTIGKYYFQLLSDNFSQTELFFCRVSEILDPWPEVSISHHFKI